MTRGSAHGRQHARHSCQAGCNAMSANPQGLVTRYAQYGSSLTDGQQLIPEALNR